MTSEPGGTADPAPGSADRGGPAAGGDRPTTRADRPTLLGPSRLRPVELDLVRVFWTGVGLWTVATLVSGVLALTGRVEAMTVAICVVGLVLGLLGVAWSRRRR